MRLRFVEKYSWFCVCDFFGQVYGSIASLGEFMVFPTASTVKDPFHKLRLLSFFPFILTAIEQCDISLIVKGTKK